MKDGLKVFGALMLIILVVIVLVLGGIGLKALLPPVSVISDSVDMAHEVTDSTLDGQNAIYNYEWFKQQYEDIGALNKKLIRANENVEIFKGDLPESREKWSREDKNELSRLRSIATGINDMLDQAVADYDAKSKMVNRAIFKDNLPSNIFDAVETGFKLLEGDN